MIKYRFKQGKCNKNLTNRIIARKTPVINLNSSLVQKLRIFFFSFFFFLFIKICICFCSDISDNNNQAIKNILIEFQSIAKTMNCVAKLSFLEHTVTDERFLGSEKINTLAMKLQEKTVYVYSQLHML